MNDSSSNHATTWVCPRCRGFIPNNDQPGAYIGALSRCTRGEGEPVYVCSACGQDEAMTQFAGRLTPMEDWPILTPTSIPTNVERRF